MKGGRLGGGGVVEGRDGGEGLEGEEGVSCR
jgi:hypothetical protein